MITGLGFHYIWKHCEVSLTAAWINTVALELLQYNGACNTHSKQAKPSVANASLNAYNLGNSGCILVLI